MRRLALLAAGSIAAVALVGCAGGDDEGTTTTPGTTNEARWEITDLGTLGGKMSFATAINDRGQVVGEAYTGEKDAEGNAVVHAFLWEDGNMRDLGTLGGTDSGAQAINERGQIVGWAHTGSGVEHAFLWEDGNMRDLGTLGGTNSHAVAINERGQVIGQSETKSGYWYAFLWHKGEMIDLGTLNLRHQGQVCPVGSQYDESEPVAINERGQIVGWAKTDDRSMDGCLTDHAFLWEDGKMRDLGTLPGRENPNYPNGSNAQDINERGQVVGSSSLGYGSSHAFLWQNGKMSDLGTVAKDRFERRFFSTAVAINDRGQVVGQSEDAASRSHAVLWKQGRIIDLFKPGRYYDAVAINEHGWVLLSGRLDNVWQNGRLATGLPRPQGGESTMVDGINDRGDVIGSLTADEVDEWGDSVFRAVLWTLEGDS